jgi:tRNA G18 (ribose-2'-O)-methylase SpoU
VRGAGDAPEVVAGRNAVVEALRAAVPATALYAGQRLDTDDRVREAIALAAQAGLPMIEAGRAELDRRPAARFTGWRCDRPQRLRPPGRPGPRGR